MPLNIRMGALKWSLCCLHKGKSTLEQLKAIVDVGGRSTHASVLEVRLRSPFGSAWFVLQVPRRGAGAGAPRCHAKAT